MATTAIDEGAIVPPVITTDEDGVMRSLEAGGTDSIFEHRQGLVIHPSLARLLARDDRITQRSKLWYTTRTRMITCSDMASVLGESPYNTRESVMRKKTGQSRPFKGNAATRRGQVLEDVALQKYIKKTGKKVWPEDVGLMQHPSYPQIGGSPDGITLDGIIIEIKCPMTRKIIPGEMPLVYKAQVQVLMEIADMEEAHFVQYRPATYFAEEILDITVVKRDRDYFARALPVLLDFMQELIEFYEQRKLPIGTPMIDWSNDDEVAKHKAASRLKEGKGKVCKFVDDLFIVEEYNGPNKPVVRTEHTVSDTKKEDNMLLDAEALLANVAEATIKLKAQTDEIFKGREHLRATGSDSDEGDEGDEGEDLEDRSNKRQKR